MTQQAIGVRQPGIRLRIVRVFQNSLLKKPRRLCSPASVRWLKMIAALHVEVVRRQVRAGRVIPLAWVPSARTAASFPATARAISCSIAKMSSDFPSLVIDHT